MSEHKRIAIVPCSGIGRSLGSVGRLAAYEVVEEARPEDTQIVALALLVLGDEPARIAVTENPTLTIDGCKLACASRMVRERGGTIAREFAVTDTFRRHPELKAQGIAELNDQGEELARLLAEEIVGVVDQLTAAAFPDMAAGAMGGKDG